MVYCPWSFVPKLLSREIELQHSSWITSDPMTGVLIIWTSQHLLWSLRNSFYIEDITQEGTSEISHSSFYPLVYKCFGPITWGMTSWLFSSSRSQHATEFLMLPAIHGGPSEDSSLCACFLIMHMSQCISLSHCFSIQLIFFFSLSFL